MHLRLFVLLLLGTSLSVKADYWTQKANYPGNGSSRAICFSIADKGYFGCGENIGTASDFWEYDTTANTWTQKAAFGGGSRWSGVSFGVGAYGFAGLGWSTSSLMDDLWKYDPVTDTWTQMNNFPMGLRQVPASFVVGNKGYVAGGFNSSAIAQNDVWEYDPSTGAWTQKANFPGAARTQSFTFTIDSLAYLGGGFDQAVLSLNDFYEYNPNTNTWTTKSSIPVGRGDAAGFAIGCRGYVTTGQSLPGGVLNDIWEYNPSTNQWTAKTNFGGSSRDETSFFVIGEKGYVGLGGVNGGGLTSDFWQYTPDTTCITNAPTALFTGVNHICPGTCTNFTNLSTGATSYLWTFAGANPPTSTDADPSNICYMTPGNYSVTLVAMNSLDSDTVTLNNFMTVYSFPSPQGIQQNGDTLFANTGATTYQWYQDGSLIPGATNYFYVALSSGNFNVVATDENGCEVEAAILNVIASTTTFATGNSIGINVHPNPVSKEMQIQFPSDNNETELRILDVDGRIILRHKIKTSDGRYTVNTTSLSPGLYFIECTLKNQTCQTHFIKQ